MATPFLDRTPTRRFPYVTWLLIAACVFVYVFLQAPVFQKAIVANDTNYNQAQIEAEAYVYRWSVVPCEVTSGHTLEHGAKECDTRAPYYLDEGGKNVWASILFSMFLHGGLLHIAGNMLFLWVFGRVMEDRLGHLPFLLVYFVGGIVATLTFCFAHYHSTSPGLGASGAIAAIMGTALILNPKGRMLSVLQTAGAQVAYIPAWAVLGLFFASQFFYGDNTVAWEAHVGGMVFGAIVGLGFLAARRVRSTKSQPDAIIMSS